MTALRPAEAARASLERAPLLGLGEIHWCPGVLDTFASLIESPELAGAFDDIVVEFGACQHQALMDRYIAGEALGEGDIACVWRDTLYFLLWSAPVYARFFARMRALNRRRRPGERLRVVLAEPPVAWEHMTDAGFRALHHRREALYVRCIERQVLAPGRRALLIFGLRHLVCRPGAPSSLAERLRARSPGAIELVHPWHVEKRVYSDDCLPSRMPHNRWVALSSAPGAARPPIDYLWHFAPPLRELSLPTHLFDDRMWLCRVVRRLEKLGPGHVERARALMSSAQRERFDALSVSGSGPPAGR